MRVLFDTNVILDVLLNRTPWVQDAALLWQASDERRITGYMTASSATDIFYIARRAASLKKARDAIRICLLAFEICPVDRWALALAETLPGDDFEDNLQVACAQTAGLDFIATRDVSGYGGSSVPAHAPAAVLSMLNK